MLPLRNEFWSRELVVWNGECIKKLYEKVIGNYKVGNQGAKQPGLAKERHYGINFPLGIRALAMWRRIQ